MSDNSQKQAYKASDVFLPKQIGFVVHHKTIYNVWLETLFHIEQFGEIYESDTVTKHLRTVTWIAEDESGDTPDCLHMSKRLQKNLSVSPDLILKYVKKHFLQYGDIKTSMHTYGNRLCRWNGLFDQIDAVIAMLREHPNTRKAFLSTFVPNSDLLRQNEPPHLTGVQFLRDNNDNLDVFAMFRSQDIFREGLKNAFGILYLLRYIAHETGMQRGRVIITSHDAHMHMSDNKDIQQITKHAHRPCM